MAALEDHREGLLGLEVHHGIHVCPCLEQNKSVQHVVVGEFPYVWATFVACDNNLAGQCIQAPVDDCGSGELDLVVGHPVHSGRCLEVLIFDLRDALKRATLLYVEIGYLVA